MTMQDFYLEERLTILNKLELLPLYRDSRTEFLKIQWNKKEKCNCPMNNLQETKTDQLLQGRGFKVYSITNFKTVHGFN